MIVRSENKRTKKRRTEMFRNRLLARIELLQREVLNIVFDVVWEGAESWCLISVVILKYIPDIETLTILHIRILALAIGLYIGWDH